MELIGLLKGKDVMIGCIDVASECRRNAAGGSRYHPRRARHVSPERLYPCANPWR